MKVSMTLIYEIKHNDPLTGEKIEPTKEVLKEAIVSLNQAYSWNQGRTENISGGAFQKGYNVQCIVDKPEIKKLK